MIGYFIKSFKRKIARRFTKRYPTLVNSYEIENYGTVKFSRWENPLFLNRKIESTGVNFFRRFLKEGDTAIDIGANIGHESLMLGLVTGKTGITFSFDPNPYVYEILVKNAELNSDKTNINTFNFAITDKEEEFYYYSSEASFTNGGISSGKTSKHGKYTFKDKIKGIVLESFLEKNFPDRIDKLKLIKIDTEGYDKEIIKSISNLLVKYKPVVVTECFFRNNDQERFEHFHLLKDKGYSLYYFSDFLDNAEIIPIETETDMLKWRHFDLFAVME
jgi:FkbM family methyltransferase